MYALRNPLVFVYFCEKCSFCWLSRSEIKFRIFHSGVAGVSTEKLWIHNIYDAMIYGVDSFYKWMGVSSGRIRYLSVFLIVGQKAIYACSLIEGRPACVWQGTNLKCSEACMDGAQQTVVSYRCNWIRLGCAFNIQPARERPEKTSNPEIPAHLFT